MPPEMEAVLAKPEANVIEIWPDQADSVALFFAMSTQWRWVGAGTGGMFRTGLDYTPMKVLAEPLGIKVSADVLNDLRIMESAAVEQWGKK